MINLMQDLRFYCFNIKVVYIQLSLDQERAAGGLLRLSRSNTPGSTSLLTGLGRGFKEEDHITVVDTGPPVSDMGTPGFNHIHKLIYIGGRRGRRIEL